MSELKSVLVAWILGALLGWLTFFSCSAKADEINAPHGDWHLLSLDKFSMEYYEIVNNRDQSMPFNDPGNNQYGETWDKGTAAIFDLDLIKYKQLGFYWNNKVEGNATDRQFRQVAWNYDIGVKYTDYARLFWEHRSAHILDNAPTGPYELKNFVGVELIFYKRDR